MLAKSYGSGLLLVRSYGSQLLLVRTEKLWKWAAFGHLGLDWGWSQLQFIEGLSGL